MSLRRPLRTYRWTVRPAGRWRWIISVTCGVTNLGDGMGTATAWGSRERAVRKAERIVRRERERDERRDRLTARGET